MKSNLLSLSMCLLLAPSFSPLAFGAGDASPPSCSGGPADTAAGGGTTKTIPRFTNYTPGQGDQKMEGGCKSATGGIDACQGRLDDYVKGSAQFVVVATQQQGQAAEMFGCWARMEALENVGAKGPQGCTIAALADHYAKSENEGGTGVNGQETGSKMDVSTEQGGEWAKKVNQAQGAVTCLARLAGVGSSRDPSRKPGAL